MFQEMQKNMQQKIIYLPDGQESIPILRSEILLFGELAQVLVGERKCMPILRMDI